MFYGISTIVGYVIPNPFYTQDLIFKQIVCREDYFYANQSTFVYTQPSGFKYCYLILIISFTQLKGFNYWLVRSYGISTLVGYLMQIPYIYIYIYIYILVNL